VVSDTEPSLSDVERPVRLQPVRSAPVRIGDGARIGLHAAVGADVPAGAVVAPYETRAPRRSA
jgi:acetyltransferase-like isoleucine patch superfamily enzyme